MRHPVCLGYQVATPEVVVSPTATALSGPMKKHNRLWSDLTAVASSGSAEERM